MRTDNTLMLRQSLELVEPLLERGEASAALRVLGDFRKDVVQPLSRVEWSEYCYAYARCLFRLGEHDRALPKVRAALRLSGLTSEHSLYSSQTQLLGLIKLAQGEIPDAIEAFNEAYVARKRARDFQNIFRSLINLALAHLAKGDLQQAVCVFGEALSNAMRYNSQSEIHRCQFAQCVALLLAGRFVEYRKTLESVRSHPLDALQTAHLAKHFGQLAVWILDADQAQEQLKQAMIFYARERLQRPYVVCLEYLGMNEFFQGNYAKAKEYYQQVLATPEPTASAVAQTLRMLTDVYVAERDWQNAKETAAKAEQAITRINERIELAALWRAQAQIAEHERDHDVARDFFQKSIGLLQQCGARYELALTHFAVGQSIVHSSASRSEHLQQAKALFVEMDVPKRMEQVEMAIGTLNDAGRKRGPCISQTQETRVPVIVTQDDGMQRILAEIDLIKNTDMLVLITGETGTGKDLMAQYIHCVSKRANSPFVLQNATTLTESLIEGQLFGHRRGAFTGAFEDRPGLIESALRGTFALNEIGEMSLGLQAKLLDVLETGMVTRLGDNRARAVDVRFVVMTNKNLGQMLASGRFRGDLYYRVSQVHLHLPPLRDRKDDIPCLVQHFLEQEGYGNYTLDQVKLLAGEARLANHYWPGNVRELKSVVKKSCAFAPTRRTFELAAALKIQMGQLRSNESAEMRRLQLQSVVDRNDGNLAATARELGIPESTLRRQLRSLTRG